MQYKRQEDTKGKKPSMDNEDYRSRIVEKAKAVAFLKSANQKTYGRLLNSIPEQHSFKINVYPMSLSDVYEMLSLHTNHGNNNNNSKIKRESKQTSNNNNEQASARSARPNNNATEGTETSYLQTDVVPGTDGRIITHITCYNCRKCGHYTDNCPEENDPNSSNEQHVQFPNQQDHNNQDVDVLLDTGSTFLVFKNHEMLLNIRDSKRVLKAYMNGGCQDSSKVAELPGFFTVWYNPNSMINILAWSNVCKRFRITADTSLGKYITVHLSPERKIIFEEVGSGLYLFQNSGILSTLKKVSGYSYLILAEARLSDFNKHEIQRAEKAWELQKSLGFPGYKKYLWLLTNQKIKKSKVIRYPWKMQSRHYTHLEK